MLTLLAVWLASWIPLGIWVGDLDYVLTRVSRGTIHRQLYQGVLYSGLLLVFWQFWRRYSPSVPRRGSRFDFVAYLGLGLVGAGLLKWALLVLGARQAPRFPDDPSIFVFAALSAGAVALVEEAVFRGFLLGSLAQRHGFTRAAVVSSLLFAAVHLFRPGPLAFKLGYGLGLVLLALFLARIAWQGSLAAAAGFHAGIIFWNFIDPAGRLTPNWWAGWNDEATSGALAWLFTALLWLQWELYLRRRSKA